MSIPGTRDFHHGLLRLVWPVRLSVVVTWRRDPTQPRCVGRLSLQRCHLPGPPSLHGVAWAQFPRFGGVGSEEAPIEGLASVRRSNGTCGFPAYRFHKVAPGQRDGRY